MSKKIVIRLLFLIIFFPYLNFPLEPAKVLTQYILEIWDEEKGLPQNSVHAVLQTDDGYLWLGTEEGLVRFDGIKFKEFNESNTGEIKNNYIVSLFEDSRNNLWIATRGGGLVMHKNGLFRHFSEKDGLTNQFITAICRDDRQNIWIGTDRGGLFKLQDHKFTSYTCEQGLPSDIIRHIDSGSSGNLWIATIKGLVLFKDDTFRNFSGKDGLPEIHINTVYEDDRGILWIGTEEGLFKYGEGKFSKWDILPGSSECNIHVIFEDQDRNVWLGTAAHGIARIRDNEISFLSVKDGLSDNVIRSITEDREGNLWIGTALGGANCLRDGRLMPFGKKEGLCDDVVFSVFEDRQQNLWVGTNNGLNCFSSGKWLRFSMKDGLSNNVISAVSEDEAGCIYVCTDNGLNRLKISNLKIIKTEEYLRGEYVLSVCPDRAGNLWAGTLSGLYKKEKGAKFIRQLGLASKVINFIHRDWRGDLWISTLREGLTRYSSGEFTLFSTENGLVGNNLNCIYEDQDNVLWIGTINGLSRFKDGVFVNFTRKDGLFNNNIYQILEDRSHNLWMSCNKGIFRVSKKELEDFAEKRIRRIISKNFGKNDGMRSSECNGGYQTAGCKTKDGQMWFPTMKGLVRIDPDNMKPDRIPEPIIIEQVLLDGISTDPAGDIIIKPGTKRIEFFYTSPAFKNPGDLIFKYKLSGYDENWVCAGTQRSALYTNLNPGSYGFQVRAENSNGMWNEKGVVSLVEVVTPFRQTWWFILLTLTIFAVLSYLAIIFFRKHIALLKLLKKQTFIGRFKILEKIGNGGMGTIYKAKNIRDKSEIVAIKVLKEDLFKDERNRKRFKHEAAIIDQLEHPHIVKIFERGESKEHSYIVMELLAGKTLAQKISESEDGKINIKEAIAIMIQVCDALRKMHSKNIIHRDLKPENIMLINKNGNSNFVKLLDFGLARTEYQSRLTRTGAIIGTISYMSPEQIGQSEFSPACDIYSSGIIFYEMISGSDPFRGETTIKILKQIINETPIEPIFFRPRIQRQLNDLIMAMLSKKPDLRPSVGEVIETLLEIRQNHYL